MAVRRSALLTDRELFAEYPFLPGADALVRELAPSLRELLNDRSFDRARELGRARVRAASDDPTGATGMEELLHAHGAERFLSFQYARLLVGAAPYRAPERRWAVAEAKHSWARLDGAAVPELVEVAHRMGFDAEPNGNEVDLSLETYLHLSVAIREESFRLVAQRVARGRVTVGRKRAARLLQEGIRARLSEGVELTDEVVRAVREREAEFLTELATRVPAPTTRSSGPLAEVSVEKFPPCITKMRRMLNEGENLSHSGRFALASFLHRVGASEETIVDAYRGAPDFDEGITRYQVEHIARRDEGRGYSPPECATLRSHGLCFRDGDPSAPPPMVRDPLCYDETMRHPLHYYRRKGGTLAFRE